MSIVPIDDEETLSVDETETLAAIHAAVTSEAIEVVDWCGASDIGRVRSENQDYWGHDGDHFFVVADGMGGQAGGRLAAEVAVESTLANTGKLVDDGAQSVVDRVNAEIVAAGTEAGYPLLGATLLFVDIGRSSSVVVSAGDTRLYRLGQQKLELLTEDHSVRNKLVAEGLDPGNLDGANSRLDALTSFVGREGGPSELWVKSFGPLPGDRLLLCTDGVYRALDPDELTDTLIEVSCRVAAERLLHLAFARGSRDNATAVVIDIGTAHP